MSSFVTEHLFLVEFREFKGQQDLERRHDVPNQSLSNSLMLAQNFASS